VEGAPNGVKRAKMVVVESAIWKGGRPWASLSSIPRLSRASGLIWPRESCAFTRSTRSVVIARSVNRRTLLKFFDALPRCVVAMEACSCAHHSGRQLLELGFAVRLIPPAHVKPCVRRNKNDAADCVRLALAPLVRQIDALDEAIAAIDKELEASAKADETARRLMTIAGVGPVTASALLATVQDFGAFSSGREFAAFLGLTPREHSTGGKPRARATKMGDRYSHASCWFRARAPRLAAAKGITTPCAAGRAECSSARPSSTSSS
jgi:transposase